MPYYDPWGYILGRESHSSQFQMRADKPDGWAQRQHRHQLSIRGVLVTSGIEGDAAQHADMLEKKDLLVSGFRNATEADVSFLGDFASIYPPDSPIRPVSLEIEEGPWVTNLKYTATFELVETPPSGSIYEYAEPILDGQTLWDGTVVEEKRAVKKMSSKDLIMCTTTRSVRADIQTPDVMDFWTASGYYQKVRDWAETQGVWYEDDLGPRSWVDPSGWIPLNVSYSLKPESQGVSYSIEAEKYEVVSSGTEISLFGSGWWPGAKISRRRDTVNMVGLNYRVKESVELSLNIRVPKDMTAAEASGYMEQILGYNKGQQSTADGYYIEDARATVDVSEGRYEGRIQAYVCSGGASGTVSIFGVDVWQGSDIQYRRNQRADLLLVAETVSVQADISEYDLPWSEASGIVGAISGSFSPVMGPGVLQAIFRRFNHPTGGEWYRITSCETSVSEQKRRCSYRINAERVLPTDILQPSGYASTPRASGWCAEALYADMPIETTFTMDSRRGLDSGDIQKGYTIAMTIRQLHASGSSPYSDAQVYMNTLETMWLPGDPDDNTILDGTFRCTGFNKSYDSARQIGRCTANFQLVPPSGVYLPSTSIQVFSPRLTVNGAVYRISQHTNGISDGVLFQGHGKRPWTATLTGTIRNADLSAAQAYIASGVLATPTYSMFGMTGFCTDARLQRTSNFYGGSAQLTITITQNPD